MAAPKNNNFNPNGRPPKEIDWNEFEKLCELQCTQDEMADFLHVCGPTLSERVQKQYGEDYLTIYKRFSSTGKRSLRRNQFVMSKKNASMAIWLGKQWLGQKEPESEQKNTQPPMERYLQLEDENIRLREALTRLTEETRKSFYAPQS